MKTPLICIGIVLTLGCDRQIQSGGAASDNGSSATATARTAVAKTKPFRFDITQLASEKLQQAMLAKPGMTHLTVSVDVDDKRYCTGFHYILGMTSDPSPLTSILLVRSGIQLAIDKQSSAFLSGTTLDWATLKSGESGFVFRNPNENKSLPDELR